LTRNTALLFFLCSLTGCVSNPLALSSRVSANYFPLEAGRSWTYEVEFISRSSPSTPSEGKKYTVIYRCTEAETAGNLTKASFRIEQGSDLITHKLEKTPEGDIFSIATPSAMKARFASILDPTTAPGLHSGQAALRSRSRFFEMKIPEAGNKWELEEYDTKYQGQATFEAVSTPAGSWDKAIKVSQSASSEYDPKAPLKAYAQYFGKDEAVSYYADDVGLVKRTVITEIGSANDRSIKFTANVNLLSFSKP